MRFVPLCIVISGHSNSDGMVPMTFDTLVPSKSGVGAYEFLLALKAKVKSGWGTHYNIDSTGIHLLSNMPTITFLGCNVAVGANGKAYIQKVAQITGCLVYAYDDLYGPWQHGNCWCATPTGGLYIDSTWGPWKGSWEEAISDFGAKVGTQGRQTWDSIMNGLDSIKSTISLSSDWGGLDF